MSGVTATVFSGNSFGEPERLDHHLSPSPSRIPASNLLKTIDDEALTVGVIASRFADDRDIDEDEWPRPSSKIQRIE